MSGLKGSLETLKNLASAMARLPRVVALKVTEAAAAPITALVTSTFDAGETPYGISWEPGVDGRVVTLRKSGALARGLVYVASGRSLRMRLPVAYAKYQVGRRRVAPAQGSALPKNYSTAIATAASKVITKELGQ